MLPKPKRHKNNKESYLQNLYPTILKQSSNAIRVKFSRYKQNQIFTNVSFDTLIIIVNYSNSQRAGVILYLTAVLFGAYEITHEYGFLRMTDENIILCLRKLQTA